MRLRARDFWERARADAFDFAHSATRRWTPDGRWRERVEDAIARYRPPPRHLMMPLLEAFARLRADAFFVQIGSHDGQQLDPLRELVLRHQWSGIMVEPVPYVFDRLRRNYGHLSRISLENVAVATKDGQLPFYHLEDAHDAGRPGLPLWFDALGSFRREVVLSHRRIIPDIDERLVETRVPCLTLESLLRRHAVEAVDVLHLDTEGYDYEILRHADVEGLRPSIIIYESLHLLPREQYDCRKRLNALGYQTIEYGMDTWCFNPRLLPDREAGVLVSVWNWITDVERRQQPLLATRALRATGRRLLGPASNGSKELEQLFVPTDAEQRYFRNGYDDRTPLPLGAAEHLSAANPRLLELRRTYDALDLPASQHHMWHPSRVSEMVNLRYFRGDNLYQWHYPEHPRAMALTLFVYMQYVEERGGRELLRQLSEDGAFGCWTVDVAGFGMLSRDLLDSVNEILFLDRELDVRTSLGLRVLDIGAGYGRLAYRMATALPSLADYCCVDAVPESTFLSEYYLEFRDCSPPARVLPLSDVQTATEPREFDLAINIHSFSECTRAAVEWWVQQLKRLRVPHLFVVPNEADGILSREVDGGYHDLLPTLESGGYRPTAVEPVIADPAVRELTRIHDRFYLFELIPDPEGSLRGLSGESAQQVRT